MNVINTFVNEMLNKDVGFFARWLTFFINGFISENLFVTDCHFTCHKKCVEHVSKNCQGEGVMNSPCR